MYDDTAVHVYDVAVDFLPSTLGISKGFSQCQARCASHSPTNFLDIKIVLDENKKRLLQTEQLLRFHCIDAPSNLLYDSSTHNTHFYIDDVNEIQFTGYNIPQNMASVACNYHKDGVFAHSQRALVGPTALPNQSMVTCKLEVKQQGDYTV